jgi:stage II sporulation protein GA (sporulation sigma-E factor processing peptidase)
MKIYLDYIFLVNLMFDFILLTGVSIILKRNISIKRIVLGSIFGGFTMILFFLGLNSFHLFFLKIISGILMIIITFGYKNMKYVLNNFINLILLSVVLGGSLYLFNLNSNISSITFFNTNKLTNFVILFIVGIISLIIYIKTNRNYQNVFNKYFEVTIYQDNKKYRFRGYLDTGNMLKDPYFNKPIVLIYSNKIKFKDIIYVPYKTLNNKSLLECMIVDKIYIKNIGYKYNVMIGKSNDKFSIEGIDMILNEYILR